MTSTLTAFVFEHAKSITAVLFGGIVLYYAYRQAVFYILLSRIPKLRKASGIFAAWKEADIYKLDSAGVLREGYEKVISLARQAVLFSNADTSVEP